MILMQKTMLTILFLITTTASFSIERDEHHSTWNHVKRGGQKIVKTLKTPFAISAAATEISATKSLAISGVDDAVKNGLVPYNGYTCDELPTYGQQEYIQTADGINLNSHWLRANNKGPTILLFHGNGMVSGSCEPYAAFFRDNGYNTLAVTIRGYPGSEGSSDNLSYTSSLDVLAAVKHLVMQKDIPLDQIVVFGYSLGGLFATYASNTYQLPLILQNTLTSIDQTITNIAPIPSSLAKCAVNAYSEKYGQTPQYVFKDNNGNDIIVPLNSLNNIENLKEIAKQGLPVQIFYGENDKLMGKKQGAEKLHEARYGKGKPHPNLLVKIPEGNHGHTFLHDENAQTAIYDFLEGIFKNDKSFTTTEKIDF